MDFTDFVVEYNIIGISMGTIIGFGLTNWVKEFRKSVMVPYFIRKFHLSQNYGEITSASIEVLIIIALIYFMYIYLITPVINTVLTKKEEKKEEKEKWRKKILNSIENVDSSNTDINKNIDNLNKNVENKQKEIIGYDSVL